MYYEDRRTEKIKYKFWNMKITNGTVQFRPKTGKKVSTGRGKGSGRRPLRGQGEKQVHILLKCTKIHIWKKLFERMEKKRKIK